MHADVTPPRDVAAQTSSAIEAGCVGGNFRLRYPDGGPLGRWLEVLAPIYRRSHATTGLGYLRPPRRLLDLRGPHGAVFSGVVWSTVRVRAQTARGAVEANLSVHEGGVCYGVDEPGDLLRLKEDLRVRPGLAPRTAEMVADL